MGDRALIDVLSAPFLAGIIEEVKGGLPKDGFPANMFNVTRRVKGNQATYNLVEGTQKLAKQVLYGSPSQNRKLKGVSEKTITLIHSFEHEIHNMAVLENIRSMTSYKQQNLGREEIARQVKDFVMLFDNLRTAVALSALILGYIYFDEEGNLLPSASGADLTIDFAVPAGNRDQCDIEGNGNIIADSWATAGTDINEHVRAIITAIRRKTGYTIKNAFYGSDILTIFMENTTLKEIINRYNPLQGSFSKNEIVSGFLGLDWFPMDLAFFQDQDGTNQTFQTSDHVIFTPDFDTTWWEFVEGSFPVPNKLGIGSDALAAISDFTDKSGMFSYAEIQTDPPSIKHMAGDTQIPLIKVPGAVVIADTVFS